MERLFQGIESHEFAARVNLASGFRHFLQILLSQKSFQQLADLARDKQATIEILRRIVAVSNVRVDLRYENPFDAGLAAYLWVLYLTNPPIAYIGAEVISPPVNCWWTSQITERILREVDTDTEPEPLNDIAPVEMGSLATTLVSSDAGTPLILAALAKSFVRSSKQFFVITEGQIGTVFDSADDPLPQEAADIYSAAAA
ncbi:MAG: hypothetical protein ACE5IP_09195 [Terriglobia bacterium]